MVESQEKLTWDEALDVESHRGPTLRQLSNERPTLVVFLRHSGCVFCRQTLHQLAAQRHELEGRVHIAMVWMGESMDARLIAERYGVEDFYRFVDSGCRLHEAFSVPQGNLYQLLGPPVWWKGIVATLVKGHGIGRITGDVFRMPATFVLQEGKVVNRFDAQLSSDWPDFRQLAQDGCQL